MTEDDLRTRIATAISRADGDIAPDTWDYHLADAVVKALGLQVETKHRAAVQTGRTERIRYRATAYSRYVSEWIAD